MGGPLGAVVCHLVDVATAGHLLIVGVRRSHMLMGRFLLSGIMLTFNYIIIWSNMFYLSRLFFNSGMDLIFQYAFYSGML